MNENPTDHGVLARIHALVAEEKELRAGGHGLSHADRDRLRALEIQLDQAWDLLRQRRAREETGDDPDRASERSGNDVESYLQ